MMVTAPDAGGGALSGRLPVTIPRATAFTRNAFCAA